MEFTLPKSFPSFQEDRSLLRIVLVKSHREASNCWKSLLEGQYEVNPWDLDLMEKKLTLERFQTEVRQAHGPS